MARIKIRNKTSSGAPLAGDLVERELCFVEPDNSVYIKKTDGTVLKIANTKLNLGYRSSAIITTGTKIDAVIKAHAQGIFTRWDITGDVASTAVINVRKNGTLIFTSNKPTLTAQRSNSGTDMAGTTNAYNAGDIFELEIESNNNAKYFLLTLS